jgi:hypothetical protein
LALDQGSRPAARKEYALIYPVETGILIKYAWLGPIGLIMCIVRVFAGSSLQKKLALSALYYQGLLFGFEALILFLYYQAQK